MHNSIPYPRVAEDEIRIPAMELHSVVENLLVKYSMFRFDAKVAAARLVEADLHGMRGHGVALLVRLLDAIDHGHIDPRGRVLTTVDAPSFATLDGSRTIGPVAATQGAELAVSKAKEHGIGIVTVGNGQTLGSAEVYVRLMAKADVIGVCMTSTGGATLTAPGTYAGAVGNCAFAYAVPLKDQSPIVFDSACGEESWGKLRLLERYGIPLPQGILFNAQQQPTTRLADAATMLPAGGPLGFGVSLLCSILAGPLCNGWMPIHKSRETDAEDSQHFFLAISLAHFCDIEKFNNEVKSSLDKIRDLTPIDPNEPVRIPGDRGSRDFEEYNRDGIPIHLSIANEIKDRAIAKKVAVSW